MITRKKFGMLTMLIGLVLLFIGILLLCITNTVWTSVCMWTSIIINAFGIAVLITKDKE